MTSALAKPSQASSPIPKKLRDDAILEAVCQFQFTTKDLPEIVIGRLSLETKWKDYSPSRLPFADVPVPVRQADAAFKQQPVFELKSADGSRLVRLNEGMISYHVVGVQKYCGWAHFKPEIEQAAGAIFEQLQDAQINRIALRYINGIDPARHILKSVHELDINVQAGGGKVSGALNLNYVESRGSEHITTTRIAHPQFVVGTLPDRTVAIIDVEVTTPANFSARDGGRVMAWVEDAHTYEKEAFFRLIPRQVLEQLREDS